MAKVRGPLHSDSASGKVAKAIVFSTWKGRPYVRQLVIPKNPMSDQQVDVRAVITDASVAWKTGATVGGTQINTAYKTAYNEAALPMLISGFDLFIKQCMALNYVGSPKAYDGTLAIPTGPNA